jgi:5-methylcytosine-specific restriction endonuclease McrA
MHYTTKQCTVCGIVKPVDAFSPQRLRGKVYIQSRCRECVARIKREKRAADTTLRHPKLPYWDKQSQQTVRQCSYCNLIKPITEYSAHRGKYRSRCKVCETAIRKEKTAKNPQYIRDSAKRYAKRHPERVASRFKRWRQADPQKDRDRQAVRYARKKGAPIVEKISRQAIIERDNSTCYLCHRHLKPTEITLDHVIPLVRGGTHTADNLRVACRSCNCRKGAKLLDQAA